jgi:hypothetical protein
VKFKQELGKRSRVETDIRVKEPSSKLVRIKIGATSSRIFKLKTVFSRARDREGLKDKVNARDGDNNSR